jgi:hypothetical protein
MDRQPRPLHVRRRPALWWGALLTVGATALSAQSITLGLPVDCALGETCHIQQYFDHDPGAAAQDFACGPLSYDGHDGTDFAIPTDADITLGVNVVAAAAGTVRGVRDSMPDIAQGTPGAPDVTGVECGNGVVITHPGGWETQYCHLRQGSVRVAEGDQVTEGQVLGQIGQSGMAEFPHVHLSVRQNGVEVDPFAPDRDQSAPVAACGMPIGGTLWAETPAYQPGGIIDTGWATGVPDYAAVRAGTADEAISRESAALVLFGLFFGGRAGDEVAIRITGPTGIIIDHAEPLDRTQAMLFRAAGLRAPAGGWPEGDYLGEITLLRGGMTVDTVTLPLTIPGA